MQSFRTREYERLSNPCTSKLTGHSLEYRAPFPTCRSLLRQVHRGIDRDPGEKGPIPGWSSKRCGWSIGDPSFFSKSGRSARSASSVVLQVRSYACESSYDYAVTFLNCVIEAESDGKVFEVSDTNKLVNDESGDEVSAMSITDLLR